MPEEQPSIAEIKAHNPLEMVAAHYGLRLRLTGSGLRMVALCPFHQEKTPSFMIYLESQHYYCFGCGAHGDVIRFVELLTSCTYYEALNQLANLSLSSSVSFSSIQRKSGGQRKKALPILEINREQSQFLS